MEKTFKWEVKQHTTNQPTDQPSFVYLCLICIHLAHMNILGLYVRDSLFQIVMIQKKNKYTSSMFYTKMLLLQNLRSCYI